MVRNNSRRACCRVRRLQTRADAEGSSAVAGGPPKPSALVVFGSAHRKLSYWRTRHASRKIDGCTVDHANHHLAHGRLPRTCTASPTA